MKVKKDVKYIIKRIIIGVGVALILASINKCNVYADEPTNYYLIRQTDSIHSNLIYTSILNDYSVYIDFSLPYNNNINLNIIDSTSDLSTSSSYYIVFYNESLNVYYYFTIIDSGVYNNFDLSKMKIQYDSVNNNYLYYFYNNNDDEYQYISGLERSFFVSNGLVDLSNYTSSSQLNSYNFTSNYYIYNNSPLTNLGSGYYLYAGLNENLLNDFTIYDTNLSSLYINGIEQQIPLPNGYSELDISNYDGVYFVPKNYNNVQIETVGNVNFMDFNYWFKGSIKYGYFPLEYPPKIVSDYQVRSSITNFEYVDSILPLYENTDMTGYQYYSYFIYNSQKGQEAKIRYNSTLFNAFLIEDMFTYVNDNVCTINRNNENMCFKVDFQSPLDNYWLEGFQKGGDEFDDGYAGGKRKIDAYLDLLKIPFDFLRSLNRNSCHPISIPIPFTNNSITLNCLSPLFHRVLGNFYYVLFYIVSGFYVYRITIMNIDTFTDVIDPNDDKLEVIDL